MIDRFQDYTNLLLDWNKRIHLVSKGDARKDRIIRHFVDSLTIFKAVNIPQGAKILDIGSGAGFPAIPIKIVRDDVKMTLVESIHKKTLFLHKLIGILKLERVTIVNQRAEELVDRTDFSSGFDLVTAKGLGSLEDGLRLGLPLLKAGGLLTIYKGRGVKRVMEEISQLSDGSTWNVVKIRVSQIDLLRWLVVVERKESDCKGG